MRFFALSLILATAACGCGAAGNGDLSFSGGTGGTGGTGGSTGTGTGGASGMSATNSVGNSSVTDGVGVGSGGGAPVDNCSDAAKLIYVLSTDNDLYSFQPDLKKFTKIGALGCQTTLEPNSMAVDRDANAYVNYASSDDSKGVIFKVSTKDASCEAAPIISKLPTGFTRLGMGYSTDMAGGNAETLYVAGTSGSLSSNSPGLGKIDFGSKSVVPIGSFSGSLKGQSGELTGTGDARLFGFFTTTPVQLAEIDKSTGATKTPKAFTDIPKPNAWAFSFWGGDFYFYTAVSISFTNVARYRPSDGSVDTKYMTNIGFRIVGAGVSTCAPLVPPK
jgi:hypothetical protein